MNPSAQPTYDQAVSNISNTNNAVGNLSQDVQQLAPLAQTYHGAAPAAPYASYVPPAISSPADILPAIWNKAGDIASQTGDILASVGKVIGDAISSGITAPIRLGLGLGNGLVDRINVDSISSQTQALNQRQDSIMQAYKTGQMSSKDYAAALNSLAQDYQNLSKQSAAYDAKTAADNSEAWKAFTDTAVDLFTVATLGLGSSETLLGRITAGTTAGISSPELIAGTTKGLQVIADSAQMVRAADAINLLANSSEDWAKLSPLAQQVMRTATSEALMAAGKSATASQITRAVAGDLLIKFPLYFNYMTGAMNETYKDLASGKYGDALMNVGINAGMLLSGGPIGWGLERLGKLAAGISVAAGLQPGSILDELSSRVGTGDRLALGKIAQEQIAKGNTAEVKAMIVGLESNLRAAGGNQAAAVNMIIDHLQNYVGWGDMTKMSHQELWDNMVNYWKHAVGLQDLKAAGKIEGMAANDARVVVPGRFSTQDKNGIAEAVTRGDLALSSDSSVSGQQTVQDRLAAWEQYKAQNPNAAFANNPNVDKQITHLIQTIDNPTELHTAINNIDTQIGLDGIPKEYAAKMAKDGYIAIVPTSHNLPVVPFSETAGKLATSGADAGGYFVKAARPVPVLQSVGSLLVKMGMSPEAAGQRVQDIFSQKFTEAAGNFGFLHLQGDTAEQTGKDTLLKLYNYMKSPTGGMKVFGHYVPYSDMRQLTTNDIVRAFEKAGQTISKEQASQIGDAIMQAYLEVPREVAGSGAKIIDANFKLNPLAKYYSRVQGALRFAWNPVFSQARLPIKAEILAQMETGGKFPTIAGTNRFLQVFFPGQYKELDAIINNPDFRALVAGGFGGEGEGAISGAVDVASKLPPKTTLYPVAGLVKSMADRVGVDTATYIKQFPEDVHNATQALLHYNPNDSFLNSPLAKTLNVAFFPFRFNVKVAGYMARFIAKQPPAIQYAAVKGVLDAQTWLKSPAGQAWYAQHSDAVALFKYLSPVETLSTISSIISNPGAISNYGELGGLPFGWIPQALDAAGITHFGQAYVNPKTGAIAKDYVPTSAYGALNAALQDLLGSLFTYPGATAGLPSKGSATRYVAGQLLPGSSKDFNAQDNPNVTPADQQFSQIAQQANGMAGTPNALDTSGSRPLPAATVPTLKTVQPTPITSRRSGSKKKKADYTPSLLPGQSKLGQL